MQVEWERSQKGTKYGTPYEVLEGSFRWLVSTCIVSKTLRSKNAMSGMTRMPQVFLNRSDQAYGSRLCCAKQQNKSVWW